MSDYRVMVPLDGSALAEQALTYVDTLKQAGMSEILLVSVIEQSLDSAGSGLHGLFEYDEARVTDYVDSIASSIRRRLDVEVHTKVVAGNPAASIVDAARSYNPDLLLLATHGRSGDLRWRLGGVADKLARSVDCSMLIVPAEDFSWHGQTEAPSKALRTIMVPLDGSSSGEGALSTAVRFAQATGAFLHLVRVVAPLSFDVGPYTAHEDAHSLTEVRVEEARKYLWRIAAGLDESLCGSGTVLTGSPAGELREFVHTNDIDLVVMTRSGLTGFQHASLGSVTDRMLGGPKPLLIVPAGCEQPADPAP